MAAQAELLIETGAGLCILVRGVAGEAGELILALTEAGALQEAVSLHPVADLRGEVCLRDSLRGTVALTTAEAKRTRRELAQGLHGSARLTCPRRTNMRSPCAVA